MALDPIGAFDKSMWGPFDDDGMLEGEPNYEDCPGHNGGNPEEPIFCDGSCMVTCQYGGNCAPGQCPGPCGG